MIWIFRMCPEYPHVSKSFLVPNFDTGWGHSAPISKGIFLRRLQPRRRLLDNVGVEIFYVDEMTFHVE